MKRCAKPWKNRWNKCPPTKRLIMKPSRKSCLQKSFEKLNDPDPEALKKHYEGRMTDFSQALDSLVQEEEVEPDDLVAALEKLAIDFGLAQPEPSIAEEVGEKFDKKWKELRKDKKNGRFFL